LHENWITTKYAAGPYHVQRRLRVDERRKRIGSAATPVTKVSQG